MSIKANELSIGQYVTLNNKLCKLIEKMHVKPGKGGAYIQAKFKFIDGTKFEHRFHSDDNVSVVIVERKSAQFSYQEKDCLFFTDNASYDTIEIQKNTLPKHTAELLNNFAEEDIEFLIEYADSNIIDVILPNSIQVTVTSADPVVKNQTAASSYKSATINGDLRIMVPTYIAAGDKIIINPYGEHGIEFTKRA